MKIAAAFVLGILVGLAPDGTSRAGDHCVISIDQDDGSLACQLWDRLR